MTGVFAIGLMTLSRTTFRQPGMQTGIGLVAGALRFFNPFGGCFICSAIAIMAEGLLFDLIWTGFSLDQKTTSHTDHSNKYRGNLSVPCLRRWVYRHPDPDTSVFLCWILSGKSHCLHPTDPCQWTACSPAGSRDRPCSICSEECSYHDTRPSLLSHHHRRLSILLGLCYSEHHPHHRGRGDLAYGPSDNR